MAADVSDALHSPARLSALRRLDLLDTPPEAAFDRLAHLACSVLHAPVALVSLVDKDRQFFKSCVGLPEPWASWKQTPVSHSICQHAVAAREPLVIEDAREHPLVRDSRVIPDLGVIAYAGIPLVTADGHVLGTFCVFDRKPRKWTDDEIGILKDLTASVMTEIDLRAVGREVERLSLETDRERHEKAAMLDATLEGIFRVDREGRCTLINRAAARLLGYQPDEVIGKNMHALIHHTHPDGSPYPVETCRLARALETGQAVHLHDEVQWRRDGTWFYSECSSAPVLEGGRNVGAVVSIKDITERRQSEEATIRLAAIVDSSEDGIIGKTLDGTITSWNPAAEKLYGYSASEVVGKSISIIVPPDRLDELSDIMGKLARGERIQRYETVRVRKDGRRLDVSVSISPIKDATGRIIGAATVAHDIRARKRAEVAERFLAEASNQLAISLNYEATLTNVANLLVPRVADTCVIDVFEEGNLTRQFVAASDQKKQSLLQELQRRYPPDPNAPVAVPKVLRSGRSEFLPGDPGELVQAHARDDEHVSILRELGLQSVIIVPLIARGETLGAISVGTAESGRRFVPEDVALFEELGRRAALAIENARYYRAAQEAMHRERESRAEAEAARQRIASILESITDAFFALDKGWRFTYLNRRAIEIHARLLGTPNPELIGKDIWELFPEAVGTTFYREFHRAIREQVDIQFEEYYPPLDAWLEVRAYPGPEGLSIYFRDVTSRKHAEEERERLLAELAVEHSRMETILESAPHGVFFIEAETGRMIANPAAAQLQGLPPSTERGLDQYVGHVLWPDGRPLTLEELPPNRGLQGQVILAEELLLARPDGSRVPILASAAPVHGRSGEVIGAVVIFEDITPLKELERHREEWNSVIAHDLRQPVTAIRAQADLLQRRLERKVAPEELSKSVEHIRIAARNLSTMIGDLLDVSRIEARRLSLDLETVDLPALVQQVVDRTAGAMKGRPVRVEVSGDIPTIEVDPGRVEQVLGNLLTNAAKYGEPETEILVEVERRNGEVQVAVTNRGKGIPPEDIPRLFTRFHRTQWAKEERITGLGLGLYISKGLVEAHGGQIRAESIPDETTTFSFTVPIARDAD